jgi:hypothetical protein
MISDNLYLSTFFPFALILPAVPDIMHVVVVLEVPEQEVHLYEVVPVLKARKFAGDALIPGVNDYVFFSLILFTINHKAYM